MQPLFDMLILVPTLWASSFWTVGAPHTQTLWNYASNSIVLVHELLNESDCNHLINLAMQQYFEQARISSSTGDGILDVSVRKASIAELNFGFWKDRTTQNIFDRLEPYLNAPQRYWEAMQVSYYKAGGHYSKHDDRRGRRVQTMILFLNDVPSEAEGETELEPIPGKYVLVKPKRGQALVFNSHVKHSGRKLLGGEKWIINLWVHDQPLQWTKYYVDPLVLRVPFVHSTLAFVSRSPWMSAIAHLIAEAIGMILGIFFLFAVLFLIMRVCSSRTDRTEDTIHEKAE